MLAAPSLWLCLLGLGLLLCGKALEQCFQPCQQALFIAIPEGDLHLAPCQGDIDVAACRSLWECGDWLTLGVLGWGLAGPIQRIQLGLGQGVVGQCALEKQKIVLDNLPQDYIRISSGLGEASARSVLV